MVSLTTGYRRINETMDIATKFNSIPQLKMVMNALIRGMRSQSQAGRCVEKFAMAHMVTARRENPAWNL